MLTNTNRYLYASLLSLLGLNLLCSCQAGDEEPLHQEEALEAYGHQLSVQQGLSAVASSDQVQVWRSGDNGWEFAADLELPELSSASGVAEIAACQDQVALSAPDSSDVFIYEDGPSGWVNTAVLGPRFENAGPVSKLSCSGKHLVVDYGDSLRTELFRFEAPSWVHSQLRTPLPEVVFESAVFEDWMALSTYGGLRFYRFQGSSWGERQRLQGSFHGRKLVMGEHGLVYADAHAKGATIKHLVEVDGRWGVYDYVASVPVVKELVLRGDQVAALVAGECLQEADGSCSSGAPSVVRAWHREGASWVEDGLSAEELSDRGEQGRVLQSIRSIALDSTGLMYVVEREDGRAELRQSEL